LKASADLSPRRGFTKGGVLFRKMNGAAYPPAAEGINATAKSLGLEVAIEVAE